MNGRSSFGDGVARRLLCGGWLPLMVLLLFSGSTRMVSGQRFMRQGFSNQEDFGAEMKLDDNEAAVDMTREMFLMQDLPWQLDPVDTGTLNTLIDDPKIRSHIQNYVSKGPVELQLFKKRGKFGLRAVGKLENGKKLRGFWRQATTPAGTRQSYKTSDFLHIPYDDAVRSRLFTVEFELQLPPVQSHHRQKVMPSVIYQVSVEAGSMNPKALIPRGNGKVSILPRGRGTNGGGGSSRADEKVSAGGTCRVGVVPMKAGIVDPTWAKGRPIFRKGRKSGLM